MLCISNTMATIINELNNKFKIGDYIYKLINNIPIDKTVFKIIELKKVKCGNWHDGYAINTIAKLKKINVEEIYLQETFEHEYCIEYYNYMCQIYTVYAKHVD